MVLYSPHTRQLLHSEVLTLSLSLSTAFLLDCENMWRQSSAPIVSLLPRSAAATAPHWFLYYCSSPDDIFHFVSSAFFLPLISVADYSASVDSDLMREPTNLLLPSFTVIALCSPPALLRLMLHGEQQIISTEEVTDISTHQQKAVTDRQPYNSQTHVHTLTAQCTIHTLAILPYSYWNLQCYTFSQLKIAIRKCVQKCSSFSILMYFMTTLIWWTAKNRADFLRFYRCIDSTVPYYDSDKSNRIKKFTIKLV